MKVSMVQTLKMLLGIKDNEQDGLLSFLIDDMVNLILSYCRRDELPPELESLVPIMAADYYRIKDYGSTNEPQRVKSKSLGSRSVSYENTESETNVLRRYTDRLKPYRIRKGRIPSEV